MSSLLGASCRAEVFCGSGRRTADQAANGARGSRAVARPVRCSASPSDSHDDAPSLGSRRTMLQYALSAALGVATLSGGATPAVAAVGDGKMLCDAACASTLENAELVTTPSGLQYKDVKVGTGPSPPIGYQVVCNYVAMTPELRVFDSSLDRGAPYDIRIGSGAIIPGLDEGLQSMRVGGLRRMYIPGELAFPKGLPSAAGRPRVPPASPVVFDVQLLYIPGLELDE